MEITQPRRRPPRSEDEKPARAPGRLEIVQDFVNSLDLRTSRDELITPERATLWLVQRSLLPTISLLDEAEWRNALEVREGLRAVIRAHRGGESLDDDALERLNAALDDFLLCVRFGSDGSVWFESVEPGWERALAKILDGVFHAMGTGRWERLKTCANEDCRRAFYDSSENADEKWCDVRRCGRTSRCRGTRAPGARRALSKATP